MIIARMIQRIILAMIIITALWKAAGEQSAVTLGSILHTNYDKREKDVFRHYEYLDLSDQEVFDDYIRQVYAAAIMIQELIPGTETRFLCCPSVIPTLPTGVSWQRQNEFHEKR